VEESLTGRYLIVLYNGLPYPGEVIYVDEDDVEVKVFNFINIIYKLLFSKLTRKSKTEAVLQRRSMLKLGVICKFMKRYGKCFMS